MRTVSQRRQPSPRTDILLDILLATAAGQTYYSTDLKTYYYETCKPKKAAVAVVRGQRALPSYTYSRDDTITTQSDSIASAYCSSMCVYIIYDM